MAASCRVKKRSCSLSFSLENSLATFSHFGAAAGLEVRSMTAIASLTVCGASAASMVSRRAMAAWRSGVSAASCRRSV
jgi:hypothetical protein